MPWIWLLSPGAQEALSGKVAVGGVDDDTVKKIIQDAIAKTDPKKPERERVQDAFDALKELRNALPEDQPDDLNLVAAEHYLFMRHYAGSVDIAALPLPIGYDLLKQAGIPVPGVGDRPASPGSAGVMKWGAAGAVDGARVTPESKKSVHVP